jgi:lipoteichoic acid synthase
MSEANSKLSILRFLTTLLTRRDWVYLLSLLVPLIVYDLTLKAASVASVPGLTLTLDLIRSDIFFNVGYALLWIGLFAAARRRPLHRAVVVLFHAVTILVVLVNTCAYQYFQQTGTALNYGIIALWLPDLDEASSVMTGSVPLSAWALLLAALCYAAFGPWLLTRAISGWQGWNRRSLAGTPTVSFLGSLGLWLLALYFGSLSLLIGASPTDYSSGASVALVRDPVINVLLTGVQEASTTELDNSDTAPGVEHPAAHATLAPTSQTQKRNVVLIHLESTRSRSVTPYNPKVQTTPFLDELAKSSLLAERAYTIIPNTLKASISVNCGIEPSLWPGVEAEPTSLPAPGLAGLLKGQGYRTVFFQSATERFMYFGGQAKDLGYEEYYPVETMHTEGFERSNYFGYEDDVMLKSSEEWLKKRGETPFVAEYLTSTGHHDYFPPTRYGQEHFVEDEKLNRYLNCVRYLDFFLNNLIDQYKRLSLYEDTIFVIFGDHGEGFGEHGRYVHEDNPYEESLRVPLIIHAPWRFQHGERVEELSNLTDILPTVLDLLGYEVRGGKYPGYSLLRPLPEDRTLFFSCTNRDKCLASIKGYEKYIHHYGDEPDEFIDLSVDPLEKRNLGDERAEEARKRRDELLAWRSRINAMYGR